MSEDNPNFWQRVIAKVFEVLQEASAAWSDPAMRASVLRDLGLPPRADPPKPLDRSAYILDDRDRSDNPLEPKPEPEQFANIQAYIDTVDPDAEALRAALADIRAAAQTGLNIKAAIGGDQIAQNVIDSVFQLLAMNVLFRRWPAFYWITQPFGYGTDVALTDPVLEQIGKGFLGYFRDQPDGPRLRDDWLASLAVALTLGLEFTKPHVKRRFKVLHGWEAGPNSPTPVANDLGKRALSVSVDTAPDSELDKPEQERDLREARIIVTLVSILAEQGGPGTLLSFTGKGEYQFEVAKGWLLRLGVSASKAFSLYLPETGDPVLDGPADARATVTWERKPDPADRPVVLPIPGMGKSRLEFGRALGSIGVAQSGLEARLVAQKSALVLESGDDALMKRGLKGGSVRAEFDLGLGYANGSFFVDGGAALQVTLPVQRAIGPVEVGSVTIGVRAGNQPDQPDVSFETSVTLTVRLGGVTLTLDRVGCTGLLNFAGEGKPLDAGVDFKLPSGIGLKIETEAISGGGYIFRDPRADQYAGVVELKIKGRIEVKAIALLSRKIGDKPAFSLLLIITAEGFRPLNLGMGFKLTGIGGIFGIDRAINTDALEAGVKTGALDMLLFPRDPVGDAPRIVSTANAAFPATFDRNIFGAMVRIVWGADKLVTIDLAVILEFLGLSIRKVALLGKVRAAFPKPDKPVVQINLDLVGTLDRDNKRAFAHLVITAGKIGVYQISGEAAMLYTWAGDRTYVISVGGFNPRFKAPEKFPALERVKFSLAEKKGLTVDATFYVALTSNSFQIGGSVDLVAKKSKFTIRGGVGIDALIQNQQPCYAFDLRASLELLAWDEPLFKVSFKGTLLGDKPWTISGKATFEIWIFDYTVDFSHTWGETEEEAPPPALDVEPEILLALGDRQNWITELPAATNNPVVLRRTPEGEVHLHPLGSLVVTQRVAPLAAPLTRYGNARIAGTNEFRIQRFAIGGTTVETRPVLEPFAPAQFVDLSDDEKLAAPAFNDMQAGVRSSAAPLKSGAGVGVDAGYVTSIYNPRTRKAERPAAPAAPTGVVVLPVFRAEALFARTTTTRAVRLSKGGWTVTSVDTAAPATPTAVQPTFIGALAQLRTETRAAPERRGKFQMFRTTLVP